MLKILTYTAVGDAYGAGFEYASPQHVRKFNTLKGYVRNEKHALEPGVYTDDTQMAIANTEVIVTGLNITRRMLAESYVYCFKRDPREGYARGFHGLLSEIPDGSRLIRRLGKAESDKSGAAMRAVVFGIYPTVEEVLELTALQAAITHNTEDGINAARAAALAGHYFIYKLGARQDLGQFLEEHVQGPNCKWNTPWQGPVGPKAWQSVQAAVSAIIKSNSLSEILSNSIGYTGDVDTVAAVALGAASVCNEIEDDLPDWLFRDLENGEFGRDYLATLDRKLDAAMIALNDSR